MTQSTEDSRSPELEEASLFLGVSSSRSMPTPVERFTAVIERRRGPVAQGNDLGALSLAPSLAKVASVCLLDLAFC